MMRYMSILVLAVFNLVASLSVAWTQVSLKPPIIGFVGIASRQAHIVEMEAFRNGLREIGHVEGRTIVIEERYADGNADKLNAIIAELVEHKPSAFLVPGPNAAQRIVERVDATPVVAVALPPTAKNHPNLFKSISRPGGRVTGFSSINTDLSAKRAQLLKEALPSLSKLAIIYNAKDPIFADWYAEAEHGAHKLGLEVIALGLTAPSTSQVAELVKQAQSAQVQAILIIRDYFTESLRGTIAREATRAGIPTIAEHRLYAQAGALLSYGASLPDLFRRAAAYVDQILKGADPANMPIQLPTKFELVVNLNTAKTLGVPIPEFILIRADEVIE